MRLFTPARRAALVIAVPLGIVHAVAGWVEVVAVLPQTLTPK